MKVKKDIPVKFGSFHLTDSKNSASYHISSASDENKAIRIDTYIYE